MRLFQKCICKKYVFRYNLIEIKPRKYTKNYSTFISEWQWLIVMLRATCIKTRVAGMGRRHFPWNMFVAFLVQVRFCRLIRMPANIVFPGCTTMKIFSQSTRSFGKLQSLSPSMLYHNIISISHTARKKKYIYITRKWWNADLYNHYFTTKLVILLMKIPCVTDVRKICPSLAKAYFTTVFRHKTYH